jgi:hypothetical protein
MPDTHLPSVPRPQTPIDDAPVDGSAAIFAWETVPGALDYRLQIAADADFEEPVCSIETGETTALTLYELLPENGSTHYWRVQAKTAAGWQDWSQPATFKAATAQAAAAHQRQQLPSVVLGSGTGPSTDPEANAPYRVSYTTRLASLVFFTIMIASFVLLLLVLQARSLARLDASDNMVTNTNTGAALPTSYQMLDSTSRTYQIPIDSAMQAIVREASSTVPASSGLRSPN